MFQKYDHDPLYEIWTIIDTDFVEDVDAKYIASIWEAIIEVYSKRNLNVWANFARCFIDFCKPNSYTNVPHMLEYLNEELGIKTDNLEKYLLLV